MPKEARTRGVSKPSTMSCVIFASTGEKAATLWALQRDFATVAFGRDKKMVLKLHALVARGRSQLHAREPFEKSKRRHLELRGCKMNAQTRCKS